MDISTSLPLTLAIVQLSHHQIFNTPSAQSPAKVESSTWLSSINNFHLTSSTGLLSLSCVSQPSSFHTAYSLNQRRNMSFYHRRRRTTRNLQSKEMPPHPFHVHLLCMIIRFWVWEWNVVKLAFSSYNHSSSIFSLILNFFHRFFCNKLIRERKSCKRKNKKFNDNRRKILMMRLKILHFYILFLNTIKFWQFILDWFIVFD